ncbi:MAG: hypothetical protein Tsb0020_32080 [Haliangiales bacterium]
MDELGLLGASLSIKTAFSTDREPGLAKLAAPLCGFAFPEPARYGGPELPDLPDPRAGSFAPRQGAVDNQLAGGASRLRGASCPCGARDPLNLIPGNSGGGKQNR